MAVGFSGHADLAAEAGAEVVLIVHPLVPSLLAREDRPMRARGLHTIMQQANRIYGQNLLHLGLARASARFPRTRFRGGCRPRERRCWITSGPSVRSRTGDPRRARGSRARGYTGA